MNKFIFPIISHSAVAAFGFALGIYMLPILTAPSAPSQLEMSAAEQQTLFTGTFRKDLKDSDFFHWGEGEVSVGSQFISLKGSVAPGPDYKLYLSPNFVDTEDDFKALKSQMVQVGDVKTFDNFVVKIPSNINPKDYKAVIIWCESFEEFITAATYQ